jgi:hypothetical protein
MRMAGPATAASSTDEERGSGGDKGTDAHTSLVLERPDTRFAVKCGDYFFRDERMPGTFFTSPSATSARYSGLPPPTSATRPSPSL